MADPVAVLAADLHITRRPWRHREVEGDADFACRQLAEICRREDAPLVLAGDIFDSPRPAPEDVRAFATLAEDLRRLDLPLYYVQGNHDLAAMPWPRAVTDWPTHLPGVRGGVALAPFLMAGIDYAPADRALAEFRRLADAGATLVVCHQRLADLAGRPDPSAPPAAALAGPELVVIGDLHQHVTRRVDRPGGGTTTIASPGAPHRLAIDEDHPKAVFVLDDEGRLRDVPLLERPLLRFAAADAAEVDRLLEARLGPAVAAARGAALDSGIPEVVATPAVRVTLPAGLPAARGALAAAARTMGFHLFATPTPEAEPPGPEAAAVVAEFRAGGLAAAVRAHAPAGPARDLLERLVAAGPAGHRRVLEDFCASFDSTRSG